MDRPLSTAILWTTVALIVLVLLAYGLGWALSTVLALIGVGFVVLLGLVLVGMIQD